MYRAIIIKEFSSFFMSTLVSKVLCINLFFIKYVSILSYHAPRLCLNLYKILCNLQTKLSFIIWINPSSYLKYISSSK
jgi:hypothetical protein